MNKRLGMVIAVLGIIVTFAAVFGSPALGGFDAMR